jgi:hypothetical protein
LKTRNHLPIGCRISRRAGFALVVALIMVALVAVISVGVLTSVSLERGTATSYNSRYQADLAVQNGLQAATKTLAAAPFPSPVPAGLNATVTNNDAFLVVRADGPADANGNKAAYYYLAQPSTGATPIVTYYPLFSASTDPNDPAPGQTPPTINLAAADLPSVPTPAPPAISTPPPPNYSPPPTCHTCNPAWNAAGTQRLPTLYSWQQPTTPSGPSVQWVEMRDPQDTAPAPAHNLSYTRYAYWVEDLDGYLDASQVSHPNGVAARFSGASTWTDNANVVHSTGTSVGEIGMFTIFQPAQLNPVPAPSPVVNLVGSAENQTQNSRALLLTVPTLQQLAQSPSPAPSPDVAGPNLAVRLGEDNNPGEQNLVPLGYGYGRDNTLQQGEGYPKYAINPVSQFGPNGNHVGAFASTVGVAMPNFADRDVPNQPGGHGHSGHTRNYLNNLTANLLNYASPLDAPTAFMPPGNVDAPPSSRGIGAYPFVVSLYDLNNWVDTVNSGTSNLVAIETTTYVQLWNPHNFPTDGLAGALTIHYNNSDQVSVNGVNQTLSSPPDTTVIFTANPSGNTQTPVIISPLFETGNVGQPFNYQIKAANGYQDPKGKIKPNEYRVIVMPAPTPACFAEGRNQYSASGYTCGPPPAGLPPGLSLRRNGAKAGLINGTPTVDPCATYTNGYQDYNVTIRETTSCGQTPTATLTIRIYR